MTETAPFAAFALPARLRAFLAVALVAWGVAAGAAGPAAAQPAPAIGQIRVDVSPLRAKGVGSYAELVEAALGRALEAEFAGRRARGGATLTVVVDLFQLRAAGGPNEGFFGFGRSDSISKDDFGGEAFLTVDGRVIASTYLRVALPPWPTEPWNSQSVGLRRVENLANAYASRLARRL